MNNLEIVPVNNKIDNINDQKVINEKRKGRENDVIKSINKFMKGTSQIKIFFVRSKDRPYNLTREFFEEVKKILEPEGYVCNFDINRYREWFKITLPENKVNIPLESHHEIRKLVLVENSTVTVPSKDGETPRNIKCIDCGEMKSIDDFVCFDCRNNCDSPRD